MSVKQCLTSGDHTKIKNTVSKNKPISMGKQKMAEKQEKMFYDLNKDSGFQKDISGLKRMDKITAIQKKYAQNGVQITRQQVNKMMKNGVTIIKPSSIVMPKPITMPVVIPKVPPTVVIPKVPSTIVSVPKEIVPAIKPIAKVPPVGAFQEAKTLDEALEKFKEFSHGGPFGDYYTESWSNKKKLETLNRMNAQMHSMERWVKGRKISEFAFDDGDQKWNGRSLSKTKMPFNRIKINYRKRFGKYGFGEKGYGSLRSGRYGSLSEGNVSVTLRHEMGHALWFDSESSDSRLEFVKKYLDLNKTLIKSKVSDYATTNAREFFAESFAIYSSPEYKMGALNKVFGGGFEELMEKILIGAK